MAVGAAVAAGSAVGLGGGVEVAVAGKDVAAASGVGAPACGAGSAGGDVGVQAHSMARTKRLASARAAHQVLSLCIERRNKAHSSYLFHW